MRILYLLALVLPLTAYAGENEVPDPIPPDFNECVLIIVTETGREQGVNVNIGKAVPPLTREDHAYLSWYRREGWAKLALCNEEES